MGEPEEARGLACAVAGARARARPRPGLHRAGDRRAEQARVRLRAAARRSFRRRSGRCARHEGGALEARVPPVLPDGRGGQPRPRVHRHRRRRPGRTGAGVRRRAVRRERGEARRQGPAGTDRGEPGEDPSRVSGTRRRPEHRPADPVPGLPGASAGGATPPCRAGSAVVLDTRTGEVLAMANLPSFNPNDRGDRSSRRFRNRAVTDLLEPGSTVKPFTVAAALQAGIVRPDSILDTPAGLHEGRRAYDLRRPGTTVSSTSARSSRSRATWGPASSPWSCLPTPSGGCSTGPASGSRPGAGSPARRRAR